ncbi:MULTISPECIES: sialate O-acetylesterase [unclassified Spirosoma]|uniref:sialate O-acetylesterase n=1 Tax=unclassified Spirosoma TaxID=2621999 RepID=UPI0009623F51|nr:MULTISPECIES: sialate O-acetylesterase [unclassified Spirosoma]OJW79785.1 MAG: acetylxylan esterase [Spirosoma sp. 48-14]
MSTHLLFLMSSFLLTLFTVKQDVPPRLQIFLLIGQSNMAGRGDLDAESKQTNPRIWMLDKALNWIPAQDPMHFDKPDIVGVGPGLSFAQRLADTYPDLNIGLVPCAVGGSGINVWKPGAYYEPTKSHPYDDMLIRAKKALENGELAGFIWHQGESDSDPEKALEYEEKLTELVQRLRKDLNAPNAPFVAGTLGDFVVNRNPDAKTVNEAIMAATKQLPNAYYVLSAGLSDKGDATHFDTESARILGRRYADIFIQKKLLKTK